MKNKYLNLIIISILIGITGCNNKQTSVEDNFNSVTADIETTPVKSAKDEDAADDPAIWVNRENVNKSTVIGTNKKAGLCVYNLSGEELFFYPVGRVNNVDLRYDFPLQDELVDIVVSSNRTYNSITIHKINIITGALEDISKDTLFSKVDDVYGICLYVDKTTKKYYVFLNGKNGMVEQWELQATEDNKVTGEIVRNFTIASQPEGMVADDELGVVYIGEENHCIWKFEASPESKKEGVKITKSDSTNVFIEYDIEGLSIYYAKDKKGYLIASSQGNFTYAVFERTGNNKYLGSFKIDDGVIDGVQETDGLDVINFNMGELFPSGVFVTQDGFNYDDTLKRNQNFKLVSWDKIAKSFTPELIIDNIYDKYRNSK